jgi:hypothetical protein
VAGATNLHVSFQLSKRGEAIGLFAPNGTLVDAVSFPAQPPNTAHGRYPDGAPDIFSLPTPTPQTTNAEPILGNGRPVIETITNRSVILGQTLAFAVYAADPDWPPQQLTFSLGPGAPPGTHIASFGYFVWTPTAEQVPGTNLVSVIVRDDGNPPLSATNTFTIWAGKLPQLPPGQVLMNEGRIRLAINTLPGKVYQLEFTDQLLNPIWFPAGPPQTANSFSLTIQDTFPSTHPQRFYRLVVGE